jgi:hypothetical protein
LAALLVAFTRRDAGTPVREDFGFILSFTLVGIVVLMLALAVSIALFLKIRRNSNGGR